MQHVASLSYGKDSIAMLHVIVDILHWPLDRIITADVWATDTIQADLPPMVEFKYIADKEIYKRFGIRVEHFHAVENGQKLTYEKVFHKRVKRIKPGTVRYKVVTEGAKRGDKEIYGFPFMRGPWCNSYLKIAALDIAHKSADGAMQYIGIAADEPERIERHSKKQYIKMPLVEAGWTEAECREWCEKNELLSPIYKTAGRGGCWFCHNMPLGQMRELRRNYPELWALLMKWDNDSPFTFKADGHTIHDFEKRFAWEDAGYKSTGARFRWQDLDYRQMDIYQWLGEDCNAD